MTMIESPVRHATSRAFRKRLILAVAAVAIALLVTGGAAQSHKVNWARPASLTISSAAAR